MFFYRFICYDIKPPAPLRNTPFCDLPRPPKYLRKRTGPLSYILYYPSTEQNIRACPLPRVRIAPNSGRLQQDTTQKQVLIKESPLSRAQDVRVTRSNSFYSQPKQLSECPRMIPETGVTAFYQTWSLFRKVIRKPSLCNLKSWLPLML